jgi:medium-chain acyl-[acyl-carrier-protein] hydrolase
MNGTEKMKLFLLPYAGGSGLYYSHWAKFLEDYVTLIPVDLPGRGLHFKEPLCQDFQNAIERVYHDIKDEISECRYGLFGYCVGTTIAYELFKYIVDNHLKEPDFCILCANATPDVHRKEKSVKDTSEAELIDEWVRSSRISKEVMETKDYLKDMYKVWKSDCIMMDGYNFTGPIYKFNCDITLVNGRNDEIFTLEELELWENYTNGRCDSFWVNGYHDFLKTNEKELISIIENIIARKSKVRG